MLRAVEERSAVDDDAALRRMFRARKEVFIDLLKWDLPVLAGEFEVDQFDDPYADYLILLGREGEHRASARLLPTDRPHLLGDLYPHLCARPVPTGPRVREITRFCLDRHQRAGERRSARNQLVTALAQYALTHDIMSYTGVADLDWFEQIRRFGWACGALGQPVRHNGRLLVALHISIEADILERLHRGGVYEPLRHVLSTPAVGGGQ